MGDEVVIVELGRDDVPCVVAHVHNDGSCRAGGHRWKRDGRQHGSGHYGPRLEPAAKRQEKLDYKERFGLQSQILSLLDCLSTDELRDVLASLEAR